MTIIDGKVTVDWPDAVAMLERKLDPSIYIQLYPDERLELCHTRGGSASVVTDFSAYLNATKPSGVRNIFKVYDATDNRRRLEKIYESLVRRQAHRGTDEIRVWATEMALEIDCGHFMWRS